MKYLCIKNYWMEDEEGREGCSPAFVKGVTYEFYKAIHGDIEFYTKEDNHGEQHYMPAYELVSGEYFKLVEEVTDKSTAFINCTTSEDPVVEWLDKYQQVASADYTVDKIDASDYGVYLTTDHGDILGAKQVVEFINNRYDQLQKEAKTNKQKELAEKKAKLLDELSAIEKELEGV